MMALPIQLRADGLDRIQRGYALVESGMSTLAVLSVPDIANEVLTHSQAVRAATAPGIVLGYARFAGV